MQIDFLKEKNYFGTKNKYIFLNLYKEHDFGICKKS